MKSIDTCTPLPYSPLIPAVKAIGFREIYDRDKMRLQFTK